MPRVSDAHKAQRRADIVAAAQRCFARDGFAGATLQDVFAEAGISAGGVYAYFRSKHDLVLAIAEERHADERLALETPREQDAIAALKLLMQRFFDAYLGAAGDMKRRISLITWAEALFNDEVRASVRAGVDEPRAALTTLLRRGQVSGEVRRDVDAEAVAASMVAMLQGLVLQKLWDPALDANGISRVCGDLIESFRA